MATTSSNQDTEKMRAAPVVRDVRRSFLLLPFYLSSSSYHSFTLVRNSPLSFDASTDIRVSFLTAASRF